MDIFLWNQALIVVLSYIYIDMLSILHLWKHILKLQPNELPGDSMQSHLFTSWFFRSLSRRLWVRVTWPSQKGHQQNCQSKKFWTGPLNRPILSFRDQGVCSKGPVQKFLDPGIMWFFPTLHLKGQRIPPQNIPQKKRARNTTPGVLRWFRHQTARKPRFQLGGNQGFSEKSTVDGSEIRQTHQLIW